MSTARQARRRVLHLITGLETGGAEMMLWKLLGRADAQRFDHRVVSLRDQGTIGPRLAEMGIPVYALGLQAGPAALGSLGAALLRYGSAGWSPDVLQGWMYHGNLAAQALSRFSPSRPPVIWNIRQSLYSLADEKPITARLIRLSARLSAGPEPGLILCNSRTAMGTHVDHGFRPDRWRIVPNGFDTERFRPSDEARRALRRELGLPEDALLVGLVARYHPVKDQPAFIRAAARVLAALPGAHAVMAGRDVTLDNPALAGPVRDTGLAERFHLLGERRDVPELTSALDVAVSSSSAEAFSNAIGEAMACGVPCVVTDVGDSRWILGEGGITVPPGEVEALAASMLSLLNAGTEKRNALGGLGRRRVVERFSLDAVAREYESIYADAAARQG